MKINTRFALIGLTCLTLNMACAAKKNENPSLSKDKTTSPEIKTAKEDTTKAEGKNTASIEHKGSSSTDSGSSSIREATTPLNSDTNTTPQIATIPAPGAQTANASDAKDEVALATDSEAIKKSADYKISFVNLKGLMAIAENSQAVVHRQKIVDEAEISVNLKNLNEENYCKVSVKGRFNEKDFLKLNIPEMKELDKENDIYQTHLNFSNANGTISFLCTHTTYNFYVEDFYKNMQSWITVYNIDGEKFDIANFVNTRTENRIINTIKIKDLKKLEQIIMENDRTKLYALYNGKAVEMDEAVGDVANGPGKMACSIPWVVGQLPEDKIFIRVEKGVAEETPQHVPTATIFAIYRADADNYFAITCLAKKTATWSDFLETVKGILDFGVLNRTEYSKKYDEIIAIHKERKVKAK